MAVSKSRTSEAVSMLKAITDAQEVYFLANGEYTNNINDLDVVVPAERMITYNNLPVDTDQPNTYFYTCWESRTCGAFAYNPNLPNLEFHMQQTTWGNYSFQGKHWCQVNHLSKSEKAKKLCQSMGTKDPELGSNYYLIN